MYVCQPTYFLPLNCHHHWYHDSPAMKEEQRKKRSSKRKKKINYSKKHLILNMSLRAVLKTGKPAVFKHTSAQVQKQGTLTVGLGYYWTDFITGVILFNAQTF